MAAALMSPSLYIKSFSFISEHLIGRERGCLRSLYENLKATFKTSVTHEGHHWRLKCRTFSFYFFEVSGVEVRLAGPYLHGLLAIHVILDDIKDCDGEEVIYIRVGRSRATRVGLNFSWSQKLT